MGTGRGVSSITMDGIGGEGVRGGGGGVMSHPLDTNERNGLRYISRRRCCLAEGGSGI